MPDHRANQPLSASLIGETARSRSRNWWRSAQSLNLFPRTLIPRFSFHRISTEDSLANDWALVGADLYAALEEHKKK